MRLTPLALIALLLAVPANAVTMQPLKSTPSQVKYHCVNALNQELKGARKARECKTPYHWLRVAQATKKPGKIATLKPKKSAH